MPILYQSAYNTAYLYFLFEKKINRHNALTGDVQIAGVSGFVWDEYHYVQVCHVQRHIVDDNFDAVVCCSVKLESIVLPAIKLGTIPITGKYVCR